MSCIFCNIISGDIPSHTVYEDDHFLAFLDIQPVTKGHTLIILKTHSKNILDTSSELLAHVLPVAQTLAQKLTEAVGADGINIIHNAEPAAGQVVEHFHIHVIPRFEGDGLEQWKPGYEYKAGEQDKLIKKLIYQ